MKLVIIQTPTNDIWLDASDIPVKDTVSLGVAVTCDGQPFYSATLSVSARQILFAGNANPQVHAAITGSPGVLTAILTRNGTPYTPAVHTLVRDYPVSSVLRQWAADMFAKYPLVVNDYYTSTEYTAAVHADAYGRPIMPGMNFYAGGALTLVINPVMVERAEMIDNYIRAFSARQTVGVFVCQAEAETGLALVSQAAELVQKYFDTAEYFSSPRDGRGFWGWSLLDVGNNVYNVSEPDLDVLEDGAQPVVSATVEVVQRGLLDVS